MESGRYFENFETEVSSIMTAQGLTGLEGRGKAAQQIHDKQLADWESSGRKAKWEIRQHEA